MIIKRLPSLIVEHKFAKSTSQLHLSNKFDNIKAILKPVNALVKHFGFGFLSLKVAAEKAAEFIGRHENLTS
jgi:hypothetical protein